MDMGIQPVSTTVILYGRSLLLDSVEVGWGGRPFLWLPRMEKGTDIAVFANGFCGGRPYLH